MSSQADAKLARQVEERLKQQAVIAELGMKALSGMELQPFIEETVDRLAQTLQADYGAALELLPDQAELLLRAGVGWDSELVGAARFSSGLDTQVGFTLITNRPVVVADMKEESRFGKGELIRRHKIASGLSVVIPRPGGPWGVLSVHSSEPMSFASEDVSFVQALANIIGDVAERKEFEDVQAHLAAIVETSYDAIFRKTTDGIITSWNSAAERMYGYTAEEAVGQRVDLLFPPELKHTLADIMQTIRSGDSVAQDTERVCKDGSRIPIALTVSPIRDKHGNIIAASTIAHDISDRKQTEEALRRAHTELEDRVGERTRELRDVIRELEAFTYAVSHDLRAPLRSVDGFARALQEDYADDLDELAQNYLGRIINGSRRMAALIDDLLNLSRLSHSPLNIEEVNLSELARRVCSELSEREPDRNVEWDIPHSLIIPGDRHLLGILLVNLVDNAWKFSRSRDPARIELGMTSDGGRSVYYVRDNGIGFDKRYSDKLFVPFQRLHSKEVEGTGIGLATVQRIVHRHGGRLWADGAVDSGSTFYFTVADSSRPSTKADQQTKRVETSAT